MTHYFASLFSDAVIDVMISPEAVQVSEGDASVSFVIFRTDDVEIDPELSLILQASTSSDTATGELV